VTKVQDVDGVQVVAERSDPFDLDTLREIGDRVRDRLGSAVVVLGGVFSSRPSLIVMVTPDLVAKGVDAAEIVREAARPIGGGGGGQPRLAQAGGRDATKLDDAISTAIAVVRRQVR
jgi:alanyl-tRNA synthetase